MKLPFMTLAAGAFLAVSCANAATATDNYTVTLPLSEDEDGLTAYIIDFDTSAKLDSTVVDGGKAIFKGTVTTPVFARVILDGNRAGQFVLEEGDIAFNPANRMAAGSPTNDALVSLMSEQQKLVTEYRNLGNTPDDEARKKEIQQSNNNMFENALKANAGNPLGYYLFLQQCYGYDLPTFDAKLKEYLQFADSKRVQTLRQGLINKEETSVGHKFKDFEITYDGKTSRLSDYVGRGKYTLVDFWASWCGPCIRETRVIKELYEEYGPKGLDVLGVAVWDEPANTLRAIEQHELPWPQILNGQNIPTDLYGIAGIPCIILFDPEGNIISRDKQDDELRADVAAAMSKASVK
jgi:Thiol-disulfide isomerase and thioredoxins